MRIAFTATPDGGALIDQSYIGFALGGSDADGCQHTLSLIRAPELQGTDWGPYLEYDGVEAPEFDVKACRLNRCMLSLDLYQPFAGQISGPVGFDVCLTLLREADYQEMKGWLLEALRGFLDRLVLT